MAVFMINICKFNDCGLIFPGLGDLIQHIEHTHIDYDPVVVEQKEQSRPSSIPLSYVLRFFADTGRQETVAEPSNKQVTEPDSETGMKCSNSNSSIGSSGRSSTTTGSDMDDEDAKSDSEDSNDSWTTPEEFTSEFILNCAMKARVPGGNKRNGGGWAAGTKDNINPEKPFACPVPGCKKRYKNVNGIKYHSKNGHKKDGKVRKGYKCHCGKSYKTSQGLKTHTLAYHSGKELINEAMKEYATITTSTGEIFHIPGNQVTTLQPVRTLTVKQLPPGSLASLGLSVKSIQSVVLTTKPANELINKNYDLDNKAATLRVVKDISLPIVNNTVQVAPSALQSFVSTTTLKDNINPREVTEGAASGGILDEIEHVSHQVAHEPVRDNVAIMNPGTSNQNESNNNNVLKIKIEPEKDKFIRLMPNGELAPVQIKLPDPKIKLAAIKPAPVKISNTQVIASLTNTLVPNFNSINVNRSQVHEGLGILTPTASPLTSPEIQLNQLQNNPPPSTLLPLTPINPMQNNMYLPNIIPLPEPRDPDNLDESNVLLRDVNIHPKS